MSKRALAAAVLLTLVVVVVAATPQLLGERVEHAFAQLAGVRPLFLWAAALCFVCSLVGGALAWTFAVRLCGSRVPVVDGCARYGAGSLVNSFAPARLGDAVRLALFARTLDGDGRLWSTGGAFAAVGAARALVLGLLLVSAVVLGALPLWPVLLLAVLVGAAVGIAAATRRLRLRGRWTHLLDAFRTLGREPRRGGGIVGWIVFATLGRLGAAAAIAAALGVHRPLVAAVLIVPALDVAGLVPLTPGNVGMTSGAIAAALQAHGVGLTPALAVGIAFHAVETVSGVSFGAASALLLAPFSSARARRRVVVAAGAAAAVVVAAAFGTTVLAPLV